MFLKNHLDLKEKKIPEKREISSRKIPKRAKNLNRGNQHFEHYFLSKVIFRFHNKTQCHLIFTAQTLVKKWKKAPLVQRRQAFPEADSIKKFDACPIHFFAPILLIECSIKVNMSYTPTSPPISPFELT